MRNEPTLLDPEKHWECASCGRQLKTVDYRITTPLHPCPTLNGLEVPYTEVPRGQAELRRHSARHVLRERDDYIGTEIVRLHNGRPIMSLSTERPDGSNDLRVYAPTALARLG
jgi:hypothetical protein